jgi:hypothetical protein
MLAGGFYVFIASMSVISKKPGEEDAYERVTNKMF